VVVDRAFWHERRVFVSGHTGFKGAWLCLWLQSMGAVVTGFSRSVPTEPSLYALAGVTRGMGEVAGDVRDSEAVSDAVGLARPEIVFHLAAQPFVRRSFADPRGTYETNVMGTVNVLEAVRAAGAGVRAVVVVTSDKCYDNREQGRPFVEEDPMGGHDPYSNSKGCAELVADAYRRSFELPIATGRAGNVIGGGDWGEDRLVPDIMRAATAGEAIPVRNPDAVRPWQHVLNPVSGYLVLAQAVASGGAEFAEGWNFGPEASDARPVRWIADRLTELWPGELRWELDPGPHPHEAHFLSLDSTKARERLGWSPRWGLEEALASIVEWHLAFADGRDTRDVTLGQIDAFQAPAA
jgi:CDP-glucose 4,6-dehydratase